MLLREFTVHEHTINLTQDGTIYIATVMNSGGEKVFYHEYNDYEKIKHCLSEIIQKIESGEADIQYVLEALERSTM
jgi:hypothetical protein